MKINNFSFSSNSQSIHIEKVFFDGLNLLVGASGVGKTRILRSLDQICDVAKGSSIDFEDVEWTINFSHFGKDYRWDLKASSLNDETFLSTHEHSEISYEKLIEFRGNHEIEILHRSGTGSKLNGTDLPKLKRTESAITLLAEEDSIEPIAEGFKRFIFNQMPQRIVISTGLDPSNLSISLNNPNHHIDLQKFKEASVNFPTVFKGYYLQKFFSQVFEEIKETYINIFPSVKNIRVTVDRESANEYNLLFELEEDILGDWISQQQISSGMYQTLTYLVDIFSAPDGSVIVIDEFENSLGINCMPQLTDFILDKLPDLQFILTSHHPYIINNIPWKTWQLVSRTNGIIISRKAIDIPTLDTASSLDKFTQLINLLKYEDSTA